MSNIQSRPSLDDIYAQSEDAPVASTRPSLDDIFNASQAAQPPSSNARTALEQGLQGATFGFGDEIAGTLGGLGAKAYDAVTGNNLFEGQSAGDMVHQGRQAAAQQIKTEQEQHPALSLGANLAGGLLTGGAGAETAGGTALANSLRTGNVAARAAKGAIAGAASGGLYGAGTADEGKALEGAEGGAIAGGIIGGALPVAGAALGAVKGAILPRASEDLKSLAGKALNYGIPLSRTQISESPAAKTIASATGKIPLSGAPQFQKQQLQAWNRELLDTAGVKGTKLNAETWDKAATTTGEGYDKLFAGKNITFNDDAVNKLADIEQEANYLGASGQGVISKHLNDVMKGIQDDGTISGDTLNNIRSRIGKSIKAASSPMSMNADAKDALHDLRDAVVNLATLDNPADKQKLTQLNSQWKNLRTIQPLVDKNIGGYASPALLLNEVRKSYGDTFTRGNAGKIGDLARIGQTFLKDTIPDSGTAQRQMVYKTLEGIGGTLGAGAGYAAAGAPGVLGAVAVPVGLARGMNVLNTNQNLVRGALAPKIARDINVALPSALSTGQLSSYLQGK